MEFKTKRTGNPIDGDKRAEFKYDYVGRRVQKTYSLRSGSTRVVQTAYPQRFVYDGWNVVMELNANASNVNATTAITRKYTWGLDLSHTIHGAGGIGGFLAGEETQTSGTKNEPVPFSASASCHLNISFGLLSQHLRMAS